MITTAEKKPTRPGDPCGCPGCAGVIRVHTTRINFALSKRVRYMHCEKCGWTPPDNKWIVPLEHAPPRS